jgi:EAL domain-containing protein (putative c-di-GMP-specific phosphodiesterase class I)
LKIDQSFVNNLSKDSSDIALIKAIIAMAHSLGIKVIAEGIETKEQKDILFQSGCDYEQGYYFSKALDSKDFSNFVENWDKTSVKSTKLQVT